MKKEYFVVGDVPYHPNKFMIRLNFNNFPEMYTEGSYSVMAARVLGISFANYLRMCRDLYDAELIGKNTLYPIALFSNKQKVKELVGLLNKKINEYLK